MPGKERHCFPGNNTPRGFFSYYQYILPNEDAERIYCLKGGPGVGKSTFMKTIAAVFLGEGEDVDYLHCSADAESIDGILLKEKKIALLDGTAPHVTDPVSPGAVDRILDLSAFWREDGIRSKRDEILESQKKISQIYRYAYSYLGAAEHMYDDLCAVCNQRIESLKLNEIGAFLIRDVLMHKRLASPGKVRKAFAEGITPQGVVTYSSSVASAAKTIYLLESTIGLDVSEIIRAFADAAQKRGLFTEIYYCPLKPETGAEHLYCPEIETAIVTENEFCGEFQHTQGRNVVRVDVKGLARNPISSIQADVARDCRVRLDELLKRAVKCLGEAKKEHDVLESFYIPFMDFSGVDRLGGEIACEICDNRESLANAPCSVPKTEFAYISSR